MNVASLDLCRELYELSGWDDPDLDNFVIGPFTSDNSGAVPEYDLGYLLRKLPTALEAPPAKYDTSSLILRKKKHGWSISYKNYGDFTQTADTPEDVACKLAIQLFKQGILKKEAA